MKFVFQPLIDVGSSSLLGFEALTRFADGLGPAQHFQAARDEGRLVELELRAIQGILEASALLPTGVLVTLNASGSTIESFAGSSLRLDPRLVWGLELNEQSDPAVCAGPGSWPTPWAACCSLMTLESPTPLGSGLCSCTRTS